MEREKRISVRVGTFVIIGLIVIAVGIFSLQSEGGIFRRQITYSTSFESIEGLKVGAPVRLAGVEVGQVTGISFYPDIGDRRVKVIMKIDARYSDRVRGDSVAGVGSRGVLGDKVVDITIGTPEQNPIVSGGEIRAGPSQDYTDLLKKGAQVLDNTVAITNDVRGMVSSVNTPTFRQDISGLVGGASDVVRSIQSGDGALHALVYDRRSGEAMKSLLASSAAAAGRADAALGRLDGVLAQVQSGKGMVGALLYDPAGKQAVADLGLLASEIGKIATAVRTEKSGLLHNLVYGGEGDASTMGTELAAAAKDLHEIVAKVNNGDGSLGAIINDPTVYEDLKGILGNVKRNRILRELVRYSISSGEPLDKVGKRE